jgi:hypothetical protein
VGLIGERCAVVVWEVSVNEEHGEAGTMAQESKKLVVKRVEVPGTVDVDLLPWYTVRDVLRRSGAEAGMLLSPDPQLRLVWGEDEEIWDQVTPGQTVYAVLSQGPC